jgi:hypothetical protein
VLLSSLLTNAPAVRGAAVWRPRVAARHACRARLASPPHSPFPPGSELGERTNAPTTTAALWLARSHAWHAPPAGAAPTAPRPSPPPLPPLRLHPPHARRPAKRTTPTTSSSISLAPCLTTSWRLRSTCGHRAWTGLSCGRAGSAASRQKRCGGGGRLRAGAACAQRPLACGGRLRPTLPLVSERRRPQASATPCRAVRCVRTLAGRGSPLAPALPARPSCRGQMAAARWVRTRVTHPPTPPAPSGRQPDCGGRGYAFWAGGRPWARNLSGHRARGREGGGQGPGP